MKEKQWYMNIIWNLIDFNISQLIQWKKCFQQSKISIMNFHNNGRNIVENFTTKIFCGEEKG